MAWDDNLLGGSPAYGIAASNHRRIRVLAGPGAGKSFAMKRRVARILEVERVNPACILPVTFTRVAAEDLHRELVALKVPGAADLHGRTLHSLAMSILQRRHVLVALGRVPRPLNTFELEPLLADLSTTHGTKSQRKKLIRAYGAAWARLQTQEPGYTRTAEERAFINDLIDWLTYHGAMLLDELIPQLYQYLRTHPGAPEHTEFAHVLIDEYQDLNRVEQDVLGYLGARGSICIVGDDDQSIYSFKHAHPEGIRQWHRLHPTNDHAMTECRRCPTTVVRMANALIAHNADRIAGRKLIERAANGPGEVALRQYDTASSEADAVATKIIALIEQGVDPSEIIVLAQRSTFAAPIFEKLKGRNIPVKSYYAEAQLDSVSAQERFALLKLFINNEDRVALRWLLGCSHHNWHSSQYTRLIQRAKADNTSPWIMLERLAAGHIAVPHTGALVDRFNEIRAELANLQRAADIDDKTCTCRLWRRTSSSKSVHWRNGTTRTSSPIQHAIVAFLAPRRSGGNRSEASRPWLQLGRTRSNVRRTCRPSWMTCGLKGSPACGPSPLN